MYWITGAKGLLGSALSAKCKAALHSGHEVDISDAISVRCFVKKHPEITHIINAAAFSQVDAAEDFRAEAYRANVLGPETLSAIAKEIGARFTHISTDYVFPGTVNRPLTELDLVGPCNYYGKTKLQGEQRVAASALVIRTSWIFGRGGKNFVAKLLQMFLTEREIRLTNDHFSRPTFAPDLADALLQMPDCTGIFHYANSGIASKYEFGLALREEALSLGFPMVTESILPVPSSTFPSPCKRPIFSAFDTSKIEKHVPIRHWREGVRDFLCAELPAYS
jgi:dTDP-4-dehydrorhamnose reductase